MCKRSVLRNETVNVTYKRQNLTKYYYHNLKVNLKWNVYDIYAAAFLATVSSTIYVIKEIFINHVSVLNILNKILILCGVSWLETKNFKPKVLVNNNK